MNPTPIFSEVPVQDDISWSRNFLLQVMDRQSACLSTDISLLEAEDEMFSKVPDEWTGFCENNRSYIQSTRLTRRDKIYQLLVKGENLYRPGRQLILSLTVLIDKGKSLSPTCQHGPYSSYPQLSQVLLEASWLTSDGRAYRVFVAVNLDDLHELEDDTHFLALWIIPTPDNWRIYPRQEVSSTEGKMTVTRKLVLKMNPLSPSPSEQMLV